MPQCKEEKPRSVYRVRSGGKKDGHTHSYCRPCELEYNRKKAKRFWDNNPEYRERMKEVNRRTTLRRYYGISVEEYDSLLERQGGVCAICGGPPVGKRKYLDVDHCHDSGEIRALLCSPCNVTLGYMQDNPVRLRAAADYVERHRDRLVK